MSNLCVDQRTAENEIFFRSALDSLLSQIVILSVDGSIVCANAPWVRGISGETERFHRLNDQSNYFEACQQALLSGFYEAAVIVAGVKEVIHGQQDRFHYEYPGPDALDRAWFSVRVTRFDVGGVTRIVVAHDDISRQKRAELNLQEMKRILEMEAATDVLTSLANRRGLDRTLEQEWKRNQRTQTFLSVAILDVDHFKGFNDHFGHPAGDDCLRKLANVIRSNMRRPGDFGARYGGEEFAVILPGTPASGAATVLKNVLEAIRGLAIAHPLTTVSRGVVTVSIGFSTMVPDRHDSPVALLKKADEALYRAKANGRDQLICSE